MEPFAVRRLVTQVEETGAAAWFSDGPAPGSISAPDGLGVANLWAFDGAPTSVDDGADALADAFTLTPPPGGATWRVLRLPPADPDLPPEEQFLAVPGEQAGHRPRGMHATDTLDLMVVLDGRVELEVEEGHVQLAAGDIVVQRGTQHRWRVLDERPCTYSVVMVRPDAMAPWPLADLAPRPTSSPVGLGPRRVVTGFDASGRSVIVSDGEAPGTFAFADRALGYSALWETGGSLGSPLQGGDPVRPWIQLQPLGDGLSCKAIVLPSASDGARLVERGAETAAAMQTLVPGMRTTGHHDPEDPALHRTDTIDLGVILEGAVELELPGAGSRVLGPGDCVVQRGTWHKWHNVGHGPARFVSVMFGVPAAGEPLRVVRALT